MAESVKRYRITAEQYHRMGEAGILPEDARVELLDGEIVEMSPIGSRHGSAVNRLISAFAPVAGRVVLSAHNPLDLPGDDEPVPDFMLLRARADAYAESHPGAEDVLLVVEVADTSLPTDRGRKAAIYARHGVPEYWIVDLVGDRVEVRRRPEGSDWAETRLSHRGDTIIPGGCPEIRVGVEAILPPPPRA